MGDNDELWDVLHDSIPHHALDPFIMMAFARSNFFPTTTIADRIRPTPEQLALKPGDRVIAAMTNAVVNNEMTIGTVVNPEEVHDQFPDWEERMLNSWMLLAWESSEDFLESTHLGWFERARLMPINADQYQDLVTQFPVWAPQQEIDIPTWVTELHASYVDKLAELAPDQMLRPVACGQCGKRNVQLHAIRVLEISALAGEKLVDGKIMYFNIEDPEHNDRARSHLHCTDCDAKMDIEDEEWNFYHDN